MYDQSRARHNYTKSHWTTYRSLVYANSARLLRLAVPAVASADACAEASPPEALAEASASALDEEEGEGSSAAQGRNWRCM
jgi:hypothetical protein